MAIWNYNRGRCLKCEFCNAKFCPRCKSAVCLATKDKDCLNFLGMNCRNYPGEFPASTACNLFRVVSPFPVIPLIPIGVVLYGFGHILFAIWFVLVGIWGGEDVFEDSSMEEFPFTTIKHFNFMQNWCSMDCGNSCYSCMCKCISAPFALVYAIIGTCLGIIILLSAFALGSVFVVPIITAFCFVQTISYALRVFFAVFCQFKFSFKREKFVAYHQ